MVEIKTGSRIPIWWTFIFPNHKSLYLRHKLIYVDYWCGRNLVCWRQGHQQNTKPGVVLRYRGRHLEESIWRHISAVADPEWHDNNGGGQNWNWKIWRTESKKFLIGRTGVYVNPGWLFLCKRLRFGRSWTTVCTRILNGTVIDPEATQN